MYNFCEYIVKSRTPDGKEHKCVFTPLEDGNLFTVEVDDVGVEIADFYEDDDFNEISQEYVDRFKLGEIISRERKEGLSI